jgi:hypothetical protein
MLRVAALARRSADKAVYGEEQDDGGEADIARRALHSRPARTQTRRARAAGNAEGHKAARGISKPASKPVPKPGIKAGPKTGGKATGVRPAPARPAGAAKAARKATRPVIRTAQLKGSVARKGASKPARAVSRPKGVFSAPFKGAGKKASPALGALPVALALVLVLASSMSLSFCTAATQERYAGLSDAEASVASYLMAHGLDALHTAAVMGNINAESGFSFDAVEASSGEGHGLCQWSFGRFEKLQSFAASRAASWTGPGIQLDFLWAELTGEGPAAPFTSVQYDHPGFQAIGTLDDAVYAFGRGFERPSERYANWERRCAAAARYYAILTGQAAVGQSLAGASEAQARLVLATGTAAWPGANLCATWVTRVFQAAGIAAPTGDARDMYAAWCNSSERSGLKVGMLVATGSTNYAYGGAMGQIYGHVGIYIGDGKVADSRGTGIAISDLDSWVACASPASPARWGWACGVDLSARA